jgi:hypothetical protein
MITNAHVAAKCPQKFHLYGLLSSVFFIPAENSAVVTTQFLIDMASATVIMFRVTNDELENTPPHNKKQIRNTSFTISQLMVKLADYLKSKN